MRASSRVGRVARVGLVALALSAASVASAHQPVMDMAPRWAGGYGFQVRYEYQFADEILAGDDEVANPFDRERTVHTTWIEGIYTWTRELRATFKLPIVDQKRVGVVGGAPVDQKGSGVGDLILGVPLRKYWNLKSSTLNVGLTPSLRLPTGSTSGGFPVGDGSWDFGLSTSVSAESVFWYTLLDGFWWKNRGGMRGIDAGDEFGIDFNLGIHPYHDNARNLGGFVMLDFETRWQQRGVDTAGTTGRTRVTLGPVLVGYWNNLMLRAEAKFPVYEKVLGTQFAEPLRLNIGVGVTF
jgi:hypothetical protein